MLLSTDALPYKENDGVLKKRRVAVAQRPRGVRIADRIAKSLIDADAFRVNFIDPFKHTSGLRAPVYLDCRNLSGDPSTRDLFVADLIALANPLRGKVIAGVQHGGVLWSLPIADRLGAPHISVRKTKKNNNGFIEGSRSFDKDTVLFEDVFNSGTSAATAIKHLTDAGALVARCYGIFAYNKVAMHTLFHGMGIPFDCLVELSDFRQPMQERGMAEEEWDKVLAWADNPQAWHDTWVAVNPES